MKSPISVRLTRSLEARVAALGAEADVATQGVLLAAILRGLEAFESKETSLDEVVQKVRLMQAAEDGRRRFKPKGPSKA